MFGEKWAREEDEESKQNSEIMDKEAIKRYLENEDIDSKTPESIHHLRRAFFVDLIMQGLHIDSVQPGRILSTFTPPLRLSNADGFTHTGALAMMVDMVSAITINSTGDYAPRVTVDISISCFDSALLGEEIEIEAEALRVGNRLDVASIEFRNKKTRKVIARGHMTTHPAVPSKL